MTTKDRPRTSRGYYQAESNPQQQQTTDTTTADSTLVPPPRSVTRSSRQRHQMPSNNDKESVIPRPPSAQRPPRTTNQYDNAQLSPRRRRYMGLSRENSFSQQNIEFIPSPKAQQNKAAFTFDYADPLIASEAIDRPISSRLSKFQSPLPPIGSRIANGHPHQEEPLNEILQPKNDISTPLEGNSIEFKKTSLIQRQKSQMDLTKSIRLPPEPSSDEKDSILIGVTLPDGRKFHRHFLLQDPVQIILDFASLSANIDFKTQNCKLLERPKKLIEDFNETIENYQLRNRTMLIVINDDNIE